MRWLMLVVAPGLAIAACSEGPAPRKTEGEVQKTKMDLATKRYAECISSTAADANVDNDAAGTIANKVMVLCKETRNTLMADVIAFHQIGHPKTSIAQSKAVAEASIATIEDELRQATVVGIVSRQIAGSARAEDGKGPTDNFDRTTGRDL